MRPAPETQDTGAPAACSTVLVDGSCPQYSREIAIYRALPSQGPIAWVDISAPSTHKTLDAVGLSAFSLKP